MKYKNNTKKTMFFKLGKNWVDVKPGNVIVLNRNNINKKGLVPVDDNVETEKKDQSFNNLSETELNKMTKDELNDYAARNGFTSINTYMLKKEMVNQIMRLQNG